MSLVCILFSQLMSGSRPNKASNDILMGKVLEVIRVWYPWPFFNVTYSFWLAYIDQKQLLSTLSLESMVEIRPKLV